MERLTPAAWLTATILTCCLSAPCAAQRLERGAILVATPSLGDTSFVETVILVLDHSDEDGSVGVIINRPTTLTPRQVFPDSSVDAPAGTVFYGGPVMPTRAFLLLRSPADGEDDFVPIVGDIFLSGAIDGLGALPADERTSARARVYAGHARWGPGQLAAEVSAGAWIAIRPDASVVFSETPLALWRGLQTRAERQDLVRAD